VKKGKVKQYIPEEAQPYFLANNGKKLLKWISVLKYQQNKLLEFKTSTVFLGISWVKGQYLMFVMSTYLMK
jgi:hypothetical protein